MKSHWLEHFEEQSEAFQRDMARLDAEHRQRMAQINFWHRVAMIIVIAMPLVWFAFALCMAWWRRR